MTIIKGPDGRSVKVDEENRLAVFAVGQPLDRHLNDEGLVWSAYFKVTPAAANDYFFYLKNTGLSDLAITDIRVSSSVATALFYEYVSGTPAYVVGTDPQLTNRKLGSSKQLAADIKYDTDITGLTSEGVLFFEKCDTVDRRYKLSTSSNVIIPQGQAVAFSREEATGELTVLVSIVETE